MYVCVVYLCVLYGVVLRACLATQPPYHTTLTTNPHQQRKATHIGKKYKHQARNVCDVKCDVWMCMCCVFVCIVRGCVARMFSNATPVPHHTTTTTNPITKESTHEKKYKHQAHYV